MGKLRHPNLHAVKMVIDIANSYRESLRSGQAKKSHPDISDLILDFVEKVENAVDNHVDKKKDLLSGRGDVSYL